MANHTPEERKLLSMSNRALFIGTMFFVCMFDFADRAVFTVTAQTIKVNLGLNDFEIGVLGGPSFAVLYSVVGMPIGLLAERWNRIRIVATCTAIWSAATMWCGMASNYLMLALGRVGVGIGEAGFIGPTVSMNSDLHASDRRASRMSLILMGTPAGTFIGATLGGWAADPGGLDNWRAGFWFLGAGGIATAALVWVMLRHPARGLVDDAPRTHPGPLDFSSLLRDLLAFLRVVVTKKALFFVLLGGGLASIGMTSISNFMNIFLQRVHHLSPGEAGPLFGSISALALAIGLIIGSFGSDLLAKGDRRWSAWAPAIGLTGAPIVYFLAFSAEDSLTRTTILLVAAGATLLLFYGPTVAMIQNLVGPQMRATGAAFYSMLYALIGYGLGPPSVGFLSDRLAAAAFEQGVFHEVCRGGQAPEGSPQALVDACADASATGIQHALMIAVCVLFLAAVSYLFASRTLRDDFYQPDAASQPPKDAAAAAAAELAE